MRSQETLKMRKYVRAGCQIYGHFILSARGGDFWQMEQQGLVVHQRQGCLLCPNMGWKSEPEAEGIDSPALVEVYFLCLPEDEQPSGQSEVGIG